MLKKTDVRSSGSPKGIGGSPKFYPCFWLWTFPQRQTWRGAMAVPVQVSDWVFNIIFKKDYSFRYREVSAECRGHETRHDG